MLSLRTNIWANIFFEGKLFIRLSFGTITNTVHIYGVSHLHMTEQKQKCVVENDIYFLNDFKQKPLLNKPLGFMIFKKTPYA